MELTARDAECLPVSRGKRARFGRRAGPQLIASRWADASRYALWTSSSPIDGVCNPASRTSDSVSEGTLRVLPLDSLRFDRSVLLKATDSASCVLCDRQSRETMKPSKFKETLSRHSRETRELLLSAGGSEVRPVTAISGAPWWPSGVERPVCSAGHAMAFMAQVSMIDVPGSASLPGVPASFHYCQECAHAGRMACGWNDENLDHRRYDLRFLLDTSTLSPDGRGIQADPVRVWIDAGAA